jgi:hypothetical protein
MSKFDDQIAAQRAEDAPTIYEQLKSAGVPLDNHYSDLYAQVTPESTAILREYEYWGQVTTFVHQVAGQGWYDIPFAFDPYWARRKATS